MKKNLFFTFCFSFIPGAGQMYQGYMKRGGSILIVLTLFCMLTVIISTPIMMFPIMALFAYSFFDTFNVRNRIGTDKEVIDDYIWNNKDMIDLKSKFNMSKRHTFFGIILIIFGAYILLNSVIVDLAYSIPALRIFASLLSNYLPPIVIAVICIYIGIKFISKKEEK
ncbi:MAG: hypothetical protein Q4D02_04890 [Clostridia bacterium]|nr:hypothetical protein [Clostridia bacterium]